MKIGLFYGTTLGAAKVVADLIAKEIEVEVFDVANGIEELNKFDSLIFGTNTWGYVDFKAYKEKGVIYCNMREKPFYESMPTEPEVVLADLIQIFHPQLLSGHQPGYYELLK